MTRCQRCHGYLYRDLDALLVCINCGRPANAPEPLDIPLVKGAAPDRAGMPRGKAVQR